MFDTMLESRSVGVQARSRWVFPVAVLSHIMLIGAVVTASLLVTVSLKEPASSIIFAALAPAPPPLPPPPGRPQMPAATETRDQVEEPASETEELLQPVETLEDLPIVDERESGDLSGDDGVPGGLPGGDPDGVLGGDPDGVPGGAPGGPGTAGPSVRGPLVVTPEMTRPVLKRRVEPEYPEVARQSRLQGRVILQAVISATGRVEEVTVIRSSNPLFDQAAAEAVRQWEYEPARQGGKPVAVYFMIDVVFTLR